MRTKVKSAIQLKSKRLTFGVVSFRQSTKISVPGAKAKLAAIIERLRELGMHECVVQAEAKVDKMPCGSIILMKLSPWARRSALRKFAGMRWIPRRLAMYKKMSS